MRKILVVDDALINRKIIKGMLAAEYSVIEAASGEEALEVLNREYNTISAVLLDIVLPGIDGYGVLSSIRADKRFSGMPVIVMTASDDEKNRVKSLRLKANDFVMKPYSPEVVRHCLQNSIALHEAASPQTKRGAKVRSGLTINPALGFKNIAILSFIASLVVAVCLQHFTLQSELQTTCQNVTVDFTEIMDSYRHSFKMFEMLLQQEIENAADADEIESFLKAQDKRLLAIEGGDYDGVYMYYQGKYLYSWDTPYSAYADTGYDATKRPWYIGAVEAKGDIFFSTPYPSYANDYMLSTISRLQEDGETVIAYDIKLGEIGKFIDRLNLYNGALALIGDADGNIIGSTDHLFLGGNYTMSPVELDQAVEIARQRVEAASTKDDEAETALKSVVAQRQFAAKERNYLMDLLAHKGTMRYSIGDLSFGYAYANDYYTCIVMTPITMVLPRVAILWAALSFAFMSLAFLIGRMLRRNRQILSDALTGLNNRRAFMKYCDNHILHHADENLGLLMLDLNHFKKINDLFGHATGDQALLDAAAVLKRACEASKDNYFLCRYGGDEFLLAARIPDAAAVNAMINLIAEGFSRKNQTSITPYVLEASMGVSCGICNDRKSLELLLAHADQAMYEDKRHIESINAAR